MKMKELAMQKEELEDQTQSADDEMLTIVVKVLRNGEIFSKLDRHNDCPVQTAGLLAAGALAEVQRNVLSFRELRVNQPSETQPGSAQKDPTP